MKTGMNLLLWARHITQEHFPLIARLKAEGFDGVEIPLFEGDAAHYKKLRAELDKNGLACTAVTCVPPEASPISEDAKVRAKAVDQLKWAIEMSSISGPRTSAGRTIRRSRSSAGSRRPRQKSRA